MEPTNQELLTHILYIKERVDEHSADVRVMGATAANHETRITVLEKRPTPTSARPHGRLKAAGVFLGGLLSGFIGGKATGG